jgi:hypothetical protein
MMTGATCGQLMRSRPHQKSGAWLPGLAGRHYYGLKCSACGEQLAILNDLSNGAAPVTIVGGGKIQVTCPKCSGMDVYEVSNLAAFTHP